MLNISKLGYECLIRKSYFLTKKGVFHSLKPTELWN